MNQVESAEKNSRRSLNKEIVLATTDIKGAKMTVAAVRNPSPQRYARLRDGVADWAPEGDSPRVPIHPIIKAEREAYGTPTIVTLCVLYRLWRDGRFKISRHGLIPSESEWTNQQIK